MFHVPAKLFEEVEPVGYPADVNLDNVPGGGKAVPSPGLSAFQQGTDAPAFGGVRSLIR